MMISVLSGQQKSPTNNEIYKISKELLAGEGLDPIKQKDPNKKVYQKKVYDGAELAVYMVAIGTGITNEFKSFPMEEFIFWINGKAVVEPVDEESFEVHSGDYFIQAKGFNGKWNFVDNGGLHLELAVIAKQRPDASIKSPIKKALIVDRDIISGITKFDSENESLYTGVELTLNMLSVKKLELENIKQERLIHILNGVLIVNAKDNSSKRFYPGDFLIIPPGFTGTLYTDGLQDLRMLEVLKTKED